MRYKVAQITALKQKLSELPAVDDSRREVSKREAIKLIADDVRKLRKRGYSMESIANILADNGLQISMQTLKSYVAKSRRTRPVKIRKEFNVTKSTNDTSLNDRLSGRANDSHEVSVTQSSGFTPRHDSKDI